MSALVLSLISALLLSACAVGPNFHASPAPQVKSYTARGDAAGPRDAPQASATTPMPEEWWTAFGSPDLDKVMGEAFAHSPDLASAQATLAEAREETAATTGALMPQVSLSGQAGRQKYGVALFGPSDFTVPPFTYYEIGPSVSYALDLAGGLRRAGERQQALADVQGYQLDAAYLTLSGNVALQALTMAAARAQIAASNEIIAEDERNVRLVQATFNAGTGTRTDILSAQSQLDNDRALLPAPGQQLDAARHALSVLAGKLPAEWQPPEFALQGFKLPERLPLTVPSELAHRRPDILAAESQLHAASAGVGVATARLYPSITLSADVMQEALNPASVLKGASGAFGLAAGLTAPLFDGGTLRAERRAAIDAYNVSQANYRRVLLHAFQQVADALQAIRHDTDQIEAQRQAVATADKALNLARMSYQAGNTGIIQVLDAERNRSQARLGLVHAEVAIYGDEVDFYLALGGGSLPAK
jgi:NodT family efflux transporter outer membrane factor (OMF) lipoprotein